MNDKKQNIWSKVGAQIQNHQPNAYEEADWLAMEELLVADAKVGNWTLSNLWKALGGLFLVGVVVYSLGWNNQRLLSEKTSANESNITEVRAEKQPSKTELLATSMEENNSIPAAQQKLNSLDAATVSGMTTNSSVKNSLPKGVDAAQNKAVKAKQTKKQTTISNANFPQEQNGLSIEATSMEEQGDLEKLDASDASKTNSTPTVQDNFFERTAQTSLNALTQKSLLPLSLLNVQSIPSSNEDLALESLKRPNRKIFGNWKAGIAFGMTTAVTDYQNIQLSVTPHIGLFFSRALNRRWEFQAEVQFKHIRNYDLSQFYEEDVVSSLGVVGRAEVTLTYQQYNAFEIPVVAKYALNNRFGILGGLRYTILNTSDPATSISSGGGLPAIPLISRVPKQGFWDNDFGLVVGLEYYFAPKWRVDVRYNQGFRDITPDNLYQDSKNHFNSDLQVAVYRNF